jgi:hypothetical protein
MDNVRKFRILFDPISFNSRGEGIALFDFILTFVVAYLIEPFILSKIKISRLAYYLSLIPLGIIIHLFTTSKSTFLNGKLFNNEINIYKILIIINVIALIIELVRGLI